MEQILNNTVLLHHAEKIFDNLEYDYLEIYQGINQLSEQTLDSQKEKQIKVEKFASKRKISLIFFSFEVRSFHYIF